MKTFLIILSILIFPIASNAQSREYLSNKPNEIGLTLTSVSIHYHLKYSVSPYFSFMDGIIYKRHFKNNALRTGVFYAQGNDKGVGDFMGTSDFKELKTYIGFQRIFGNKIHPYISADLLFAYTTFHHNVEGGFSMAYSAENAKIYCLGVVPGIGFNIPILRSFSISAETGLAFAVQGKRGTEVTNEGVEYDERQTISLSSEKFVIMMEPLRISMNYAF